MFRGIKKNIWLSTIYRQCNMWVWLQQLRYKMDNAHMFTKVSHKQNDCCSRRQIPVHIVCHKISGHYLMLHWNSVTCTQILRSKISKWSTGTCLSKGDNYIFLLFQNKITFGPLTLSLLMHYHSIATIHTVHGFKKKI